MSEGRAGARAIEERLRELEASQAVIALLYRLCTTVDDADVEAWLDCFALGGVFTWAPRQGADRQLELRGHAELKAWFVGHRLDHPVGHQMHLLLHPVVSVRKDGARATSSYCTLVSADGTGTMRLASSGQYRDSLTCDAAGKWHVTEHHAFGFMPRTD